MIICIIIALLIKRQNISEIIPNKISLEDENSEKAINVNISDIKKGVIFSR